MFGVEERARVRSDLVRASEEDPRITAAALLGSGALDREDRWSDIDLALCLADDADRADVIDAWTERMYRLHRAVHHLDVGSADKLYRVFLLESALQVDLSFWSTTNFRPAGPKFRLLFGEAGSPLPADPPAAEHTLGLAWLYALHARSSAERGRVLQAEYMLSTARHQVLVLACLRHGLPTREGRGFDDLPDHVTTIAESTLITALDRSELLGALAALTGMLLEEARYVDAQLAERLSTALDEMSSAPS